MLIISDQELKQKDEIFSKKIDTEDVRIQSLCIPNSMSYKLKNEKGRETKLSMLNMFLIAAVEHYVGLNLF